MPFVLAALAGVVVGHAARIAAPRLARLKDRRRPFRMPWVEVVTAAAFVLVQARAGAAWPWYLFVALLAAMTATDLLAKLIPDRVTFPGTVLGIVASTVEPRAIEGWFQHRALVDAIGFGGGFTLAVLGAALGFLFFETARRLLGVVAKMEVMGMGDSKLMMMMGAFLGPQAVIFALLPGLLCGILIGVPYTRIAKSPHFPFGPALGLGGLLTALFVDELRGALAAGMEALQSLRGPVIVVLQLALLGVAVWLMLRVRRRSREYTRQIEEEYDDLERD